MLVNTKGSSGHEIWVNPREVVSLIEVSSDPNTAIELVGGSVLYISLPAAKVAQLLNNASN